VEVEIKVGRVWVFEPLSQLGDATPPISKEEPVMFS